MGRWVKALAAAVWLPVLAAGDWSLRAQAAPQTQNQSTWSARLDRLAMALKGAPDTAVAAALELLSAQPAELGLTPSEKADLLADAFQVLDAQARTSDAERALVQRVALVADDPEHPSLEWADRTEDLARYKALHGDPDGALALQDKAVALYVAQLGRDSPVLAPHLELQLTWMRATNASAARTRRFERMLETARAHDIDDAAIVAMSPQNAPNVPLGKIGTEQVRLFYATNRKPTGDRPRVLEDPFFTGEPGPMVYGYAYVTVPQKPSSSIPRTSLWALEVSPAQLKATVVRRPTAVNSATEFQDLIHQDAQAGGEILVYIHGFNNSFSDAAKVAANLAIDLDIRGPPVLYSWPSRDHLLAYWQDEATLESESANYAGQLEGVISALAARNPSARIYVVAHSMGNRVALAALARIASSRPQTRLAHVVLASPDVASADYPAVAAKVAKIAQHVTLYSSRRDRAIFASHLVHRGDRAGFPHALAAAAPGDKIDTSSADDLDAGISHDLLGHDDYLRGALTDMRALLWFDEPPAKRCILSPAAGYFEINGGRCALADYDDALRLVRRTPSKARALQHAQERIGMALNDEEAHKWERVRDLLPGIP